MELRNKFIINSLIGFILGIFVGIAFWIMTSQNPEGRSLVLHLIMSGLHGMIPVGAATVYSIESWGVTKSTVIHASITLATIVCIELPMKWWSPGPDFVLVLIIYVIIYAAIWLFNYLYWKRTIKEINEQLELIHKQTEKS